MFSVRQKRYIADKVQAILRETAHPELPTGEIRFLLHVDGAESWSWIPAAPALARSRGRRASEHIG